MIHELSDNCYFVGLSDYSSVGEEFQRVNQTLGENNGHNVIMDFSRVHMLTSSHLSNMMILRDMLKERGRRLILCSVSFQIKCEFTVCGLRDAFEFAEDKHSAIKALATAG